MSDGWPLPVDVRGFEAFAVVAEELHFTRAAGRLRISQPALSQQIARLERQLGVQLFVRGSGGVSLTPAGAALWREVQPALTGLRVGIAAARAANAGGARRLRVQHLSSYGPSVLPMIAAHLREVEPNLDVELREASVEEQLNSLRRRAVDVVLFHLDPDVEIDTGGIAMVTLTEAPRYVATPRGHPLADAGAVQLADLAGEVWVMPVGAGERSVQESNVIAACRRHGFTPRISQRANSIETMLGLVAAGFGVAPTPWAVALRPPPSVHLLRLVDDHHRVVVAHLADGDAAEATEQFIRAAAVVVEELLTRLTS